MGTEENKAIVRRFIDEAFNKGNVAVVDELATSNYIMYPAGAEVSGPEAVKQWIQGYHSGLTDYNCMIEAQIAEGDTVVTRWTVHATHGGPLFGIPPTGKQVAFGGVAVDRMANGKMVTTWLEANILGLMQQIGGVPA